MRSSEKQWKAVRSSEKRFRAADGVWRHLANHKPGYKKSSVSSVERSQGKMISKSCYGGSMKSYTPGGPRNRLFVSRRAFSFFYRTRFDHCDPSYEHCHSAQHIRKQVMREVAGNRRVRADSCTKTCTLRIDLFTQQTCVSRSGMERGGRESC